MKPLRIEGKSDEHLLVETVNYIHKRHKIPLTNIKKDWFISINAADYSYYMAESLPESAIQDRIIHHPDIMILDEQLNLKAVIELDGSIHNTHSGRRKTEKRNQDYNRMDVRFVAINLADLKDMGITIEDVLDSFLGR